MLLLLTVMLETLPTSLLLRSPFMRGERIAESKNDYNYFCACVSVCATIQFPRFLFVFIDIDSFLFR